MLLCNFKLLFVIENGHNFAGSLSENEEGGLPLSINSGPIVFGIAKQQIENYELKILHFSCTYRAVRFFIYKSVLS